MNRAWFVEENIWTSVFDEEIITGELIERRPTVMTIGSIQLQLAFGLNTNLLKPQHYAESFGLEMLKSACDLAVDNKKWKVEVTCRVDDNNYNNKTNYYIEQ